MERNLEGAQAPQKTPEELIKALTAATANLVRADFYALAVPQGEFNDAYRAVVSRFAALSASLDALHGAKFSDRVYAAMISKMTHLETSLDATRKVLESADHAFSIISKCTLYGPSDAGREAMRIYSVLRTETTATPKQAEISGDGI